MQKRDHAQRQHIIHSFDVLLYQLHVLSFFMSPSIWNLFCRIISQVQCSKPRVFDPNRSLRVWFIIILFFNATSLWYHATEGATKGKAVILDFVGMAHVPSKIQLLFLDVLIVFLQMLVAAISYETSLSYTSPSNNSPDPLLPHPPSSDPLPIPSPSTSAAFLTSLPAKSPSSTLTTPYIIDVRLGPIVARLRNSTPPTASEPSLPLPNTTSATSLAAGLGMLARARMQTRRSQARRSDNFAAGIGNEDDEDRREEGSRNLPGSMHSET